MTDEPTTEVRTRSSRRWPLSNYPIFLAMALLGGAGLSLAFSTDATANRLAGLAYYSLAVGLGLRVTEHVLGEGLRTTLFGSFGAISTVFSRFGGDDRTPSSAANRGRQVIGFRITRATQTVVLSISFVVGILFALWWFGPRAVESGELFVTIVLVPVLVFDYCYFSS